MLNILWDTRQYYFWLTLISLFCFLLERLIPWRRQQKILRKQFGQDLFWLVFNGHYAGILVASVAAWLLDQLGAIIGGWPLPSPAALHLLLNTPLWVQFIVFLLLKDLLEYGVHNLLHRVPWMWEFHKLHHSILELDWIGNMRFHWMEIVIYKSLTYLPLVILGVDGTIILSVAIVNTLIGHLNHANLPFGWGPLRYILNSPRFHVWHHDAVLHGKNGQNFGVVFSLWDWLFGTAYRPADEHPQHLGFSDLTAFPKGLVSRLVYPFWKKRRSN